MAIRTDDVEGQPLLVSQQPNYEGTENTSAEGVNGDRGTIKVEQMSVRMVILYIVLLIGGTLALVFFIKGFIDAGDVEASPSRHPSAKSDIPG